MVGRLSPLEIRGRMGRWRWLGLIGLSLVAGFARAAETTKLDCGINSLFVLLKLEGREATIPQIEAALPPRRPDGYSMAELAAAASRFGLDVEGVRCEQKDRPPDRPAICFIKDAKGGHFAVFRPVGVTGTMVQVIDPPFVPWIVDFTEVAAAKSWMGRVLVVRQPGLSQWVVPAVLLVGLALIFWGARRGYRRIQPAPT